MPKFKVRVQDTVTSSRETEIEVEAATEEEACDKAIDAAEARGAWTEEQIDNTPWETEILSSNEDQEAADTAAEGDDSLDVLGA